MRWRSCRRRLSFISGLDTPASAGSCVSKRRSGQRLDFGEHHFAIFRLLGGAVDQNPNLRDRKINPAVLGSMKIEGALLAIQGNPEVLPVPLVGIGDAKLMILPAGVAQADRH